MFAAASTMLACALATLIALAVLLFVRKRGWHHVLAPHNDAIGIVYSAIALFYAVELGFSLIAVRERFNDAEAVAGAEANAAQDLYILAAGVPSADQATVRGLINGYVDAVVDEEWQAMHSGTLPNATANATIEQLWAWYLAADPAAMSNPSLIEQALTRLQDARRTRLDLADGTMGDFVLLLLAIAAIPTILGPCMLGVQHRTVHAVLVISTAIFITFMVASVFLMNFPFSGDVQVAPDGLRRLQATMSAT